MPFTRNLRDETIAECPLINRYKTLKMALSLQDLQEMTSGFAAKGYRCLQRPMSPQNPVKLDWTDYDGRIWKFRLWVYEVTHGGGFRDEKESRIQITNAPSKADGMDQGGAIDLIMGYSPSRRVLVAYDRRWLEKRMEKGEGSPSVQVREDEIQAALTKGMHHFKKGGVAFGVADIVTLTPEYFPEYLRNHKALLTGAMEAGSVTTVTESPNGSLWQFCLDRGFYFDPDLLARYVASLAAKPFVILAGVSGTGKSKMAELVAEYYSTSQTALAPATAAHPDPVASNAFVFDAEKAAADPSRFALVPVRPDWIDNQSIMGFVNPITGKYESTQALDLMLRASKALEETDDQSSASRYFMLLDEMNLARVEHYFSDWLACAESRRYQDKNITQQPIPLHRHATAAAHLIGPDGIYTEVDVPNALEIPTNLVVTGTVNVDETTFGFSPKVLDRSMVIEFNDVDLNGMRYGVAAADLPAYRFPKVLPPFRLPTTENFKSLPLEAHDHLVAINKILEKAQLHFGYRSAAEISLFMQIYHSILPEDVDDAAMIRALDGALLQKVLPRIQGNRARIEEALCTLLWYFRNLADPEENQDVQTIKRDDVAKLPKSYSRGFEMLERLRGFGFVTFFK